ncbi:diguanylate cyclase [Caldimonas thermodepolymerans]|uniref:GGDEF domain-containing protein n=1 Tax=Caldimonas thermodepolymerans TaxID=215580 RepID=UPI0011B03F02|nr:diguanylate cyclase [Caldimonas thermodepolymerans]QPC30643.1 diguanylate cyclase [Caldimonas thermodepolymerans]
MDLSAVSIASAALVLLLAGLTGLAVRRVPDSQGARYWALAFVPLSIGSFLVGQGDALPALWQVLREPILLSGYGLLLIGLRQYLRRSRPWVLAGTVVLTALVAAAFFSAVVPYPPARVAVRSAGIFVLMCAALLALRHLRDEMLRDVRYYLQACFCAIAVLAVVRAGVLLLPQDGARAQYLHAALTLVMTMLVLAVVAGLALLMTARMNDALARLTVRDPLTGVFNRRGIEAAAATTLSFARRLGCPVALLACDVDHFKAINDRHGHAGGDEVLKAFGRLLAEHFAAAELVGRVGGEEFVVLLPGADEAQARATAETLRLQVERHPFALSSGHSLHLTLSIGVAVQARSETSWDDLLRRADQALYQTKEGGRNRIVVAQAAPPSVPVRRLRTGERHA